MNSIYISGPAQIKEMILIIKIVKENSKKFTNKYRSRRFEKLPHNKENLSDWTIKAMKGFGLLKVSIKERKNEILELTDLSEKIYNLIKKSPELENYLIEFEVNIRSNPSAKILHDDEFNTLIEGAGIIDQILINSDDSPSFNMAENFFSEHNGEFEINEFQEEFWKYINTKEIKNDSKTATGYENRVPSFIKYMKNMGFLFEHSGSYFWTPNESSTSFEIIDDKVTYIDEKKQVPTTIRRGQTYFRNKLLKRDKKCLVCNINHPFLLAASHIKKHSKSTDNEKYDIENGIILCSLHDKLFEMRYISFDDNGQLLKNEWVSLNENNLNFNFSNIEKIDFQNIYFKEHRKQFNEINNTNDKEKNRGSYRN